MHRHYLAHLGRLGKENLHPSGFEGTKQLIHILHIHPEDRLLEIGCGTGSTMALIGLTTPALIDGIDILPEMLSVAQKRLQMNRLTRKAYIFSAHAEFLPFREHTYEKVYTESVLGFQNESSARAMLTEVFRVLKPGDLYVANEAIWKAGVSPRIVASIYTTSIADFGLCQASEQGWDCDDWKTIMRETGFEILDVKQLAGEQHSYMWDFRFSLERMFNKNLTVLHGILFSKLLNLFYRSKSYLVPSLIRQRKMYQR